MVIALLLLTILSSVLLLIGFFFNAPKPFLEPSRDVLICAAHSDDCVIMGAEYAYEALTEGRSIYIVYLTCSGDDPETEISKKRQREAISAWKSLGVPVENMTFLDLPQTDIGCPSCQSEPSLSQAHLILVDLVNNLPKDSAIILPAAGESHSDHRMMRKLALKATNGSKRPDLVIYETPEYNNYYSIVHAPSKSLRYVVRVIPLMSRVVSTYKGPCNFVNGGAGLVFQDTPEGLRIKKNLLKTFESQDGNLLIHYFGYPSLYRQILNPLKVMEESSKLYRFNGSQFIGISVDLILTTIASLATFLGWTISQELTMMLSHFSLAIATMIITGGGIVAFSIFRVIKGKTTVETSIITAAVGFGISLGATHMGLTY